MISRRLLISAVLFSNTIGLVVSWSPSPLEWTVEPCERNNRRRLLQGTGMGLVGAISYTAGPALAAPMVDAALDELAIDIEKLEPIPDLLENKEWDKVRSILKVPPVNKLWNLGDSQNTILQVAKSTGNVDLFELKEDLAYNLQMCDQLTYDNAFVYFQPGNGKFKIKEPQELIRRATKQIQTVIDLTKEDLGR